LERQGELTTSRTGKSRGSRLARRCLGLSLVEVMIAGALLAIVVMLTVMAYTGSANTWLAIDDRLDLNQTTRRAVNRIAQEARMAKVVTVIGSNQVNLLSLDGEIVTYRFDSSTNEILRNDQLLAPAVKTFAVELEGVGQNVLRVEIETAKGSQTYRIEQRVKLRNTGS